MEDCKNIAIRMLDINSVERKEAEKMIGCKLEDMTKEQKIIAVACITAFHKYIR